MLTLQLVQVPKTLVVGPNDKTYRGKVPNRALYVHPEVYSDLEQVASRIVISDLFRSPEASLDAMMRKAGVQPPSFSDHGFGGAFDVSIGESVTRGGFKNRRELDEFLTQFNWPMFWIKPGVNAPAPNKPGMETWHHSHLAPSEIIGTRDTAGSAEARVQRWYGDQLKFADAKECQEALRKIGYYNGAIDGNFGPLSSVAYAMHQRSMKIALWHAKKRKGLYAGATYKEGSRDRISDRLLAYRAADKNIIQP